ncbi:MAG: hypothetical protein AMXMBFR50_24930 [Ignavibacterium album]
MMFVKNIFNILINVIHGGKLHSNIKGISDENENKNAHNDIFLFNYNGECTDTSC